MKRYVINFLYWVPDSMITAYITFKYLKKIYVIIIISIFKLRKQESRKFKEFIGGNRAGKCRS